MERRRFMLVVVAGAAIGFAAHGCLSPTLPLPPPEVPESIELSETDGIWAVRGRCTVGAVVIVQNRGTGVIAGTEDRDRNGRYLIRLPAKRCHGAQVTELVDGEASDSTFFTVQPTTAGLADDSCE